MKRISLLCLAFALAAANSAQAQLTMQMSNGWNFTFAGNVNAFHVYSDGDVASAVDGGLVGGDKRLQFTTGLLPAFAVLDAKGKEGGIDLGVHFGFGIQVQQGGVASFFGSQAAGAQIDMRQVYLTFGGPWGSILAGKELGVYQRQNILQDMTIFGVGTVLQGARGTALGRIGFGYSYTDFRGQITYSTAAGRPFTFTIGLFDPTVLAGGTVSYSQLKTPRVEAEFTYASSSGGGTKFTLFGSGLVQNAETPGGVLDETAYGGAGGIRVDVSGFSLVGVGHYDQGLGTPFQGSVGGGAAPAGNAIGPDGEGRTAYGYYGQVTYTPGGSKLTVGGSFGEDRLDQNTGDPGTLLKRNRSYIGVLSYQISKSLRLVGEYARSEASNHANDPKNKLNQGAAGFMLFF